MIRPLSCFAVALSLVAFVGCTSNEASPEHKATPASSTGTALPPTGAPSSQPKPPSPSDVVADSLVGKAAPDFTLNDLEGKPVSLKSFAGKTVVLEWFNPECPYVKAAHGKGSLVTFADEATKTGVVWLAINSGAAGKQGHDVEKNTAAVAAWNMKHPVLRDLDGAVGKAYGATNTPHMYVINDAGVVVYQGAIDNSPDGEGQSPTGGTLVNHVAVALKELADKKPVTVASTKAYGCSVKY
jgi:peroxiredoxin